MNDAQTWTVIGGFIAAMALIVGLVLRMVQTEIRSLHSKIDASTEILSVKFEALDRDVQRLVEHWLRGA